MGPVPSPPRGNTEKSTSVPASDTGKVQLPRGKEMLVQPLLLPPAAAALPAAEENPPPPRAAAAAAAVAASRLRTLVVTEFSPT